jgi:general secretion pathway protein D
VKNLLFAFLVLSGLAVAAQTPPAAPPVPTAPAIPRPATPTPGGAVTGSGPKGSATPLPAPPLRPGSIIMPSDGRRPDAAAQPATPPGTAEEPLIAIPPQAPSTNTQPEELLPAGTINFPATDLNQVLQIYAELVNRTILRPTTLPAPTITLKTQTPLTRREAIQAFDSVLALNGIAMINVGDKFVKAVPVAQANQEGAPFSKLTTDQLPELGQYVTHVVQLKYTKPTEMVQVLQPFAKIPNAILPIDSSQILVLRDNTENVKRMLEMIREVDVAVPSEYISEVIPIKYALASEIASALNSLSSGGGGTTVGASTTQTRSGFGASRTGTGFGSGGMGYPGSGMMPGSRFGAQSTTTTQPGTGSSFTDRLQNIIRRASVSGEIVVLGETKIIADERTNSLLIFASREDMKMIKDIVSKLDVVLAQVLIEAVIIEVTLKNNRELGVSFIQYPQSSGNVTGVGAGGAGKYFSPGDFIPGGGTNAAGALTGGFNYLARFNQDLDVTVSALANNSRARVLQRPRIQTSHAVQAQLFVGESRPYPTGSYYGGGAYGSYSSIQQLQIGVTLDVTPLINPDGLVVMDIHQTIENYAGFTEITGVGQVPNTTRKEAAAKVAVRDRDTIIVGGMISSDRSRSGSGVPILMDIPLLGYLFRKSTDDHSRNELIVLIRPTVLPTPEVAALEAIAEKDRMPGVKSFEKEVRAEEEGRIKSAEQKEKKKKQPEFQDFDFNR